MNTVSKNTCRFLKYRFLKWKNKKGWLLGHPLEKTKQKLFI